MFSKSAVKIDREDLKKVVSQMISEEIKSLLAQPQGGLAPVGQSGQKGQSQDQASVDQAKADLARDLNNTISQLKEVLSQSQQTIQKIELLLKLN